MCLAITFATEINAKDGVMTNLLDEDVGAEPKLAVNSQYKLNNWMSPTILSGFLTIFFLTLVSYVGFGLLASISTPTYQLQANDEKNKENNREW